MYVTIINNLRDIFNYFGSWQYSKCLLGHGVIYYILKTCDDIWCKVRRPTNVFFVHLLGVQNGGSRSTADRDESYKQLREMEHERKEFGTLELVFFVLILCSSCTLACAQPELLP